MFIEEKILLKYFNNMFYSEEDSRGILCLKYDKKSLH